MILKYPQIICCFYLNHYEEIINIAKKTIKNYYNLPITYEDLVSMFYLKMMDIEVQTEYYNSKQNIDQFIFSRIKYYMLDFCKRSIPKKTIDFFSILENDDISCDQDYYEYKELFNELTLLEFNVLYEKNVNKESIKQVAKKYNMDIGEISFILTNSIRKIRRIR